MSTNLSDTLGVSGARLPGHSHSIEAIAAAVARGAMIWELDTANSGDDDILIGSREEVVRDILAHHEIEDLPAEWRLRQVWPERA